MPDGRSSNVVPFPFARVRWLADQLDQSDRENLGWEDNVVHFPFRPYEPAADELDGMHIEIVEEV